MYVTYITIVLVSIKSPSSQLTGAFRLYLSQGATAVVHGCSIRAPGPKCGVGVDLVDCNAVGGGHVATSTDQSVRISACGALALEEYKQAASVQPLLCNS